MKRAVLKKSGIGLFGLLMLVILTTQTVHAQDEPDGLSSASHTDAFKRTVLADGTSVDQITVNTLPDLTEIFSYRDTQALASPLSEAPNVVLEVPAYDQSFGAFATAGAMIAGYYDRNGYSQMYTGPTDSGVMPLNNTVWGRYQLNGEDLGQCPLIASRDGLDGLGVRGHVDDYWIQAGSEGPDPFDGNWTEHAADCVGDYMKSSKWFGSVGKDYNKDGSAVYNYKTDGSPTTATFLETTTRHLYDAGYGLKLFYESRGYTVDSMYNQYILGHPGTTTGLGFTLAQYKAEIDAGRPVIIHLQLPGFNVYHVMVGVGYDSASSVIFVHDGIDQATHSMTWGGSYNSTFDHIGVTIVQLNSRVMTSLAITGPTEVNENGGGQYTCTASYSDGSSEDVSAIATWAEDSNYATINSSGYLTTSGVDSDQPCQITASYSGQSTTHDLTIKYLPTVTPTAGTGGSISPDIPQDVEYGTTTQFTLTPDSHYHLDEVTGTCPAGSTSDNGDGTWQHTTGAITTDCSVNALFAIDTYSLDYSAGANGTLTGPTAQIVTYGSDGEAVTAVPAENYHFVDWSDGSLDNPRTDTYVTENISVTANFYATADSYTLNYSVVGNGTLTGTTFQEVPHGDDGTAVTAVPADNHHFVDWSDGSLDNPRHDRNVLRDISVAANFVIDPVLQLIVDGPGTGTVTSSPAGIDGCATNCSSYFTFNSNVTLSAVASEDSIFIGWSGDEDGACPGIDNCTITMNQAREITATFGNKFPWSMFLPAITKKQ